MVHNQQTFTRALVLHWPLTTFSQDGDARGAYLQMLGTLVDFQSYDAAAGNR